jgi:hypothetical protein
MILTKEVKVNVNNKNIKHFKSQNLDVKYGESYDIEVKYLPRYSKYRVVAQCESCGFLQELSLQKYHQNWERSNSYNCKSCNNITYKKSMTEKYGEDNPSKIKSCIDKRKNTCVEKYGSEYIISSEYSKKKIKETLEERYGGHQSRVPEIRDKITLKGKETKIKNGLIIPDEDLSDWLLYRRFVRKLTERNRKFLLEKWDGIDYYDGEYIKDNFNLSHTDPLFPTLDHKISIIYGFKNDIPLEDISKIENLCMTKRKINSSKSHNIESDFITKKDQL